MYPLSRNTMFELIFQDSVECRMNLGDFSNFIYREHKCKTTLHNENLTYYEIEVKSRDTWLLDKNEVTNRFLLNLWTYPIPSRSLIFSFSGERQLICTKLRPQ